MNFSNASSDVQDLNTFLQKALNKLFPNIIYIYNFGVLGSNTLVFDKSLDPTWSQGTYSLNSNYVRIQVNGTYISVTMHTINKVDLSNFKKLYVNLKDIYCNLAAERSVDIVAFGISTNISDRSTWINLGEVHANTNKVTGILEYDISNYNGEYYIYAYVLSGSTSQVAYADIYQIYLSE